jgi:uncharacterized SAM-binding protein YcdF (DUF218 family)
MLLLLVATIVLVYGERRLYFAIRHEAVRDDAVRADAVVVFGAAQYNGVPSPVFKARLDHAFDLEELGLAPLVITTGASGGDPIFTEAGVGRDYLIQQGLAEEKIVADPNSHTTYESLHAVAEILKQRHAHSYIAVSDGFHLYRIRVVSESMGLKAYGSPAPDSPIEAASYLRTLHSLREMLVMSLWYTGLHG